MLAKHIFLSKNDSMRKVLFFALVFFAGQALAHPISSLVADVNSGYVWSKENATTPLPPASLTKVMTLYLTFSALEKGWLTMDSPLPISEFAASQEPSNLSLIPGDTITVREAILALIVKSANDAAVVLAESMAPTEQIFAQMMTQAAAQLDMNRTIFKNASGLHHPEQFTTAQDMAILTLALIKNFPQYYPLFATQSFTYHDREYHTHNHVLMDYQGAEGLKTGYIAAVGYNIISTAMQQNRRIVGIVMGEQTALDRDNYVKALLDLGFQKAQRQQQAVRQKLIAPAFDPLHRKNAPHRLNMDVFAPIMAQQTKKTLALGKNWASTPMFAKTQQSSLRPLQQDDWAIQIGAFSTQERALSVANTALSLLKHPNCSIQTQRKGNNIFRSRLVGFKTRQMAENACSTLQSNNYPCFVSLPQGDK